MVTITQYFENCTNFVDDYLINNFAHLSMCVTILL